MTKKNSLPEYHAFVEKFKRYAIAAHAATNHMYDEYLPYEFHLRMVDNNVRRFIHLIPAEDRGSVEAAGWGHDLIEDARENYKSVEKQSNTITAEIVRACTNYGRGRDRAERMPNFIYEDIRNTKYATFVKLCDRMANLQYSKMTGSSMFEKYRKEHAHFKTMLYVPGQLEEMWEYIEEIFATKA